MRPPLRTPIVFALSSWLTFVSGAPAAEITGTVREAKGTTVSVTIDGDGRPAVGDKVEIFFKLPGAEEEIAVATGRVEKIEAGVAQVTIANATGEVQNRHLARITANKAQQTAAGAAPAPAPAASALPDTAPASTPASSEGAAPSSTAAATLRGIEGRWAVEAQPDVEFVFKSDGRVIIPIPLPDAAGTTINATYKLDSSVKPGRVDISGFEFVLPAHFTEEETAEARRGMAEASKDDPGWMTVFSGAWMGEVEGTQIRILSVRLQDGTVKEPPRGPTILKKLAPGEGVMYRAAKVYETSFQEGLSRQTEGKYDQAIEAYTKASEANPKDPAAYFNRALCYAQKGRLNMAILEFNRALDVDPKFPRAYHERARARLNYEDWSPELLEDCNKALLADPQNGETYVFRGAYYTKIGASEAAETDFKKATSLDATLGQRITATKQAFAAAAKKKQPGKAKKR
jgi:hypothetical protein